MSERDDVVLRVAGLRKRYGDNEVVRGLDFRDPPRRVLRPARPERRRQDDDAALLPRPHRSRRRHDRDGRPAGAAGGARGAHPRRRRSAGRQSRSRFHRHREPRDLRPLFRHHEQDARRADSEAARFRRPREQGQRRHPHAVGRDEAASHARARARQRSRAPDPRRADDRSRSAGAPSDLGRPAAAPDRRARRSCSPRISWTRPSGSRRGSRSSTTAR